MATREISIKISAVDNYSSVIKKYEQQVGHAATETKQMGAASQQTQGLMAGLKGAAVAVGGAFVAMQIGQTALEMVDLGRKGLQTRGVFEALSGGVGEAASNLEMMRRATNNTVTDMQLMSSASQMMQMGIAETGDEAARLSAMATTLGRAMGFAAEEANSSFSLMLSNTSIARLDTFGISSSRVREEMARLQSTFQGMDRSEAFKLAVLSQGQEAMARVEDTAAATGTAVDRLEVSFANWWGDASERVAEFAINLAGGVEDVAHAVQDFQDQLGADAAAEAEAAYTRLSDVWDAMIAARPGEVFNVQEVQFFVDALNNLQSGRFTNLEDAADAAARMNGGTRATADQLALIERLSSNIGEATDHRLQVEQEIAKVQQAGYTAAFVASERQFTTDQRRADTLRRQIQAAQESQARITGSMRPGYLGEALRGVSAAETAGAGMGQFVDPGQAATLASMAAEMSHLYDLASQNDMLSSGELDRIGQARDRVQELADAAQRGADAFANMTLPQAFGQGSGGMQGEINQAVINQMQAAGASPEQIAAFTRTGALASGQETQASLAFSEQIAPLIAQATTELGPQVGAALTEAVTNYLQSNPGAATQAGMMGALTGAGLQVGTGGAGGRAITVRPGDTVSGLAAQYGISQDQVMAATGTTNPRLLQPGSYGAAGGSLGFDFSGGAAGAGGGYADYSQMATSTGEISDDYSSIATDSAATSEAIANSLSYTEQWRSAQELVSSDIQEATDNLAILTSNVQQVEVAINFTGDLDVLKALMNGDLSASATVNVDGGGGSTAGTVNAIKAATRDNYGTPPGVDRRVVGPNGL